jgi:hypothetical protein
VNRAQWSELARREYFYRFPGPLFPFERQSAFFHQLTFFGNVGVNTDPLSYFAGAIENRDCANAKEAVDAVLSPYAVFKYEVAFRAHRLIPGINGFLGVLGVNGIGPAVTPIVVIRLAREGGPAGCSPSI